MGRVENIKKKHEANNAESRVDRIKKEYGMQPTVPVKFVDGTTRNMPSNFLDLVQDDLRQFRESGGTTRAILQGRMPTVPIAKPLDPKEAAEIAAKEAQQVAEDANWKDYNVADAQRRLDDNEMWMQKVYAGRAASGGGFASDQIVAKEREDLEKEIGMATDAQKRIRLREYPNLPKTQDFHYIVSNEMVKNPNTKLLDGIYSAMSDDERKTYYYISATQGKEAAERYLEDMDEQLRYRKGREKGVAIRSIENPIARHMASEAYGIAGTLYSAVADIAPVFTGEKKKTAPIEYTAEFIGQDLGGVEKVLYDAKATAARMAPSILASIGLTAAGVPQAGAAAVASGIMGLSSAGKAYSTALEEGYTKEQAKTYGTLVGASEATLQYLLGGIGALGGVTDDVLLAKVNAINNAVARVALTGGVKIGGEISEEVLQNYLEPLFRTVIFDEEYKAPTLEENLYTVLITALSTGLLEGDAIIGAGTNGGPSVSAQTNTTAPAESGAPFARRADAIATETAEATSEAQPQAPGFTKNEYSGKISNKTIRALDAIGKKLGVNISIGAPTGTGAGAYNGYYENGRIVIAQDAENPLEVVLSHEVTHHMKTAAPAEYAKFAELAINASTKIEGTAKAELISRYRQSYAEGTQTDFTEDAAIDEITADYASKLVNDVETFRELVRADKTVAERFIESVKEFIAKVKTTFSKDKTKADTASLEKYGATVSELEAAVKTYEDMIKTTQTAVTSGQFGIENTAGAEMEGSPYDIKKASPDFLQAVDNDLLDFVGNVEGNEDGVPNSYIFGQTTERMNEDIKRLTGIDTTSFRHSIGKNSIKHIFKRHGKKGKADKSMANNKDIARIGYVLENYDDISLIEDASMEFRDKYQNPAPMVKMSKKVDGTFYVVEAVPDTKAKKLAIVSAYIEKPSQQTRDVQAPLSNVQNDSVDNGYTDSIPETTGKSNPQFSLKKNTDNQGRELSAEQAEYFKDSKVRDKDGALLVMYHQTEGDFTVFDPRKEGAGTTDEQTPFGIFMKTSDADIGLRGKKQMPLYANITNPLYAETREDLARKLLGLSPEYAKIESEGRDIARTYKLKTDKASEDLDLYRIEWGKNNPEASRRAIYEDPKFNELFDIEDALIEEWVQKSKENSVRAKNIITEALRTAGYDGVVLLSDAGSWGRKTDTYIALSPEQVKNVDNTKPTTNPDIRYSLKKGNEASGVAAYESILDVAKKDSYATVSQIKNSFESGSAERLALEELEKRGYGNKNAHNLMRRLIDKGKRAARATASPQAETAQTSSGAAETLTTNDGKTTLSADNLPTIRKIFDYAVENKKATIAELKKNFERGSEERKLLISYIKKGYGKENAYQFIKELEESILRERRSTQPAKVPTPAPVETEPAKVEPVAEEKTAPVEVEKETANAEGPEPVVEEPPKVEIPEPAPETIPEATPAEDEESYIRDTGLDGYFEDIHERAQTAQDKRIEDAERKALTGYETKKESFRDKVKKSESWVKRKFLNSADTVRKIAKKTKSDALYPAYNRARSASNAVAYMVQDKQTDIYGRETGEGLADIIAPIKAKGNEYFRNFHLYLLHKHNVARMSIHNAKAEELAMHELGQFNAQNPSYAMMNEEDLERLALWDDARGAKAREYIELRRNLKKARAKNTPIFFDSDEVPLNANESRAKAETLLKQNPDFAEHEAKIRKYIDNLMQYRIDSKLATPEEMDYFRKKYPDYIPTYRNTEDVWKQISGDISISKVIGKARGGNDPILPLDVALAMMTRKVVRNGQKNMLVNKLFGVYGANAKKVEEYITDVAEGAGSIEEDIESLGDGEEVRNTVRFKKDGKTVELTVTPDLYEAFKAISGAPTEKNPALETVGKANDLYKKLATSWKLPFVIKNALKDVQDGFINTRDARSFVKNLPKAYAEIARNGEMWKLYQALGGLYSSELENLHEKGVNKKDGAVAKIAGALPYANMMVEQATRLAEFISVIEKGDVNDIDTLNDALLAAAEITTNFGESGTIGKILNKYYIPFLNPAIQGTAQIVRTFTRSRTGKQWMAFIAKCTMSGLTTAFVNDLIMALAGDDEDEEHYNRLSDRTKDNYFLAPTKDGKFVKIPKGRVSAALGIVMDRVRDVATGQKVDVKESVSRIAENVLPDNPLNNNIFKAWFEADLLNEESKGRTWYGTDIENEQLQALPVRERYDSDTDHISKEVGKALGVSPKKLNYLLQQYTGGAADIILPAFTPSEQKGDNLAEHALFAIASTLTSEFSTDSKLSNKVSGEFYEAVDEAEQRKNSASATEADAVVYKHLNRERNQMSGYNKKIREAESDKNLTSKERRAAVRVATAERTAHQEKILENLDEYRKKVEAALEKYPGKDEEKRAEYAYRVANYEMYGAEYAIRVNGNASEHKKAAEKVKRGRTTWKRYYNEYFGKSERKYAKLKRYTGMTYEKFEKIEEAMSKNKNEEDEINAIMRLGYNMGEAYMIRDFYNETE